MIDKQRTREIPLSGGREGTRPRQAKEVKGVRGLPHFTGYTNGSAVQDSQKVAIIRGGDKTGGVAASLGSLLIPFTSSYVVIYFRALLY